MGTGRILVVGGYGKVGKVICTYLGDKFPGKVMAAGRNYSKAEAFSHSTEKKVLPLEFDATNSKKWEESLHDVSLVVMCLDQETTKFVEYCLDKGIDYIDITASYPFLSQVKGLGALAEQSGSTGILGVGLSPGLTNLLVKNSKEQLDDLESADIFIMLGLGEKHGEAAIQWTLDNINTVFSIKEKGEWKDVKSFTDGKKTGFPGIKRERKAYRFDFVDQHVVPETLRANSCSTYLCFDSDFMTKAIAFYKRIGFFRLLKFSWFNKLMLAVFKNFNVGTDIYIIKTVTKGIKDNRETIIENYIKGHTESKVTGRVTALVAERLYMGNYAPGISYMEDLFTVDDINNGSDQLYEYYSKKI